MQYSRWSVYLAVQPLISLPIQYSRWSVYLAVQPLISLPCSTAVNQFTYTVQPCPATAQLRPRMFGQNECSQPDELARWRKTAENSHRNYVRLLSGIWKFPPRRHHSAYTDPNWEANEETADIVHLSPFALVMGRPWRQRRRRTESSSTGCDIFHLPFPRGRGVELQTKSSSTWSSAWSPNQATPPANTLSYVGVRRPLPPTQNVSSVVLPLSLFVFLACVILFPMPRDIWTSLRCSTHSRVVRTLLRILAWE